MTLRVLIAILILGLGGCGLRPTPPKKSKAQAKASSLAIVATEDPRFEKVSPAVRQLAESLVAGKSTDLEKAHALYSWLGENVAYDVEALYSGDLSKNAPDDVLKRKKAVCGGYAGLFHVMSKSVGLESAFIAGRSRSDSQGLPPTLQDNETNHAWNAVKIKGQWQLLDPTWGAGHVTDNKAFVQEPNDDWFLVDPEVFIHSHLPEKQEWQLLESAINRSEFDALPEVKPRLFALGLEFIEPTSQPVKSQGELDFRLRSKQGALVSALVFKDKAKLENRSVAFLNGDEATVKVRFPERGQYEVVLLAAPPSEKTLKEVARFEVEATGTSEMKFPELYGDFARHKCQIIKGFDGVLKANRSSDFELIVPGALEVHLKDGENWTEFSSRGNDRFNLEHSPATSQITILARFQKSGNRLPVLMGYEVR